MMLTIEKDDVGTVTISRYPFESVFTPQEFQEIREYCKQSEQYCIWIEDEHGGYWETGCKAKFEFIEGDIKDNSFKFCPYCGNLIRQVGEP